VSPAARVCSVPNCPTLTTGGRCDEHRRQADRIRGTARQRGYSTKGHAVFRAGVLARDPVCVLCTQALATVADHWPLSRKQLLAQRLDPNDTARGRGLCASCHNRETAREQPGGWNNR
jgi:5-methylcytosine-specific restriction enzyme A